MQADIFPSLVSPLGWLASFSLPCSGKYLALNCYIPTREENICFAHVRTKRTFDAFFCGATLLTPYFGGEAWYVAMGVTACVLFRLG